MTTVTNESGEGLRAYLPAPLIRAWAENPSRPPIWGEYVHGSLMHCDVTGFTAMSERLAERGKEGAEVMVEVLNRFFNRMLGIADSWNGEQLKFGGDAMLLLFPEGGHAPRAAACALEMQKAMRDFRNIRAGGESHSLKMRIGIHSGAFFLASVGDPENLLHLVVTGPDVNRTAEVEPAASPGKVAMSSQTREELEGRARTSPLDDGMSSLRALTVAPVQPRKASITPLSAELVRYVHPVIGERLAQGESLIGEHRRVTVMFINLLGLSETLAEGREAAALDDVSHYFTILLDSLGHHGGFLLGSDAAEDGDKIIALFAAPVSQAQPEAAALRCALELDGGLRRSGLHLRHRIGVNSGFVFAGEIGSRERREYTVIGDAVNLSARLMTAAHWGEIVVSDETLRAAGQSFEAQRMRPLRVKGKTAPVRASRLVGAVLTAPEPRNHDKFVGREIELDTLMRLAVSTRHKRSTWAYISGEAGIGKSRLLRELEYHLAGQGWGVLRGQSHAHTSHVPFGAWNPVLRSLFGVQPGDDLERFEEAVRRLAPGHAADAPLLGRMLSIRSSEGGGAEGDAAAVRQRIKDTIAAALGASANARPTLLIFEDAHWMDAQSLDLLSDLVARAEGRLTIVVSSRDDRPSPEIQGTANVTLRLNPLSVEAARRLVASEGDLDESQVKSVLERSGGNPLLLSAFAQSRSQGGLPETIEDAITSRVDVLPAPLKAAVRAAAVAGPTFDDDLVSCLLPAGSLPPAESLTGLVDSGIARLDAGGTYSFSHSVIRQVVYEMLPYGQRRRMHGQVAQYIETAQAGHLEGFSEELLHHSEGAEDTSRTVRYACMSGDKAAGVYAGDAAVSYYQQALGALAIAASNARADRSLLLEKMGDSLEVMGRHRDAATSYEESLHVWESTGSARIRFIAGAHLDASRGAELCRKTGVSMERGAEFEESLRWLDRAFAALPPGKPRLAAQICAARSVSLFRFGRYDEGIEWGERALNLARRSRDQRQIAYSHNMLATSCMERGELRKAVRHLKQSVRIYHEIADFQGQASANNNLGMCYHLQGTLDAALYYYQVALQTDQRVGDRVDAMIVRSNIGEVLMTLGRLPEAVINLSQVVDANKGQGGLIGVAGLAHVNLSRCYLASGDTKAAFAHSRLGKRLLSQAGQSGLVAEAELQRAEVLLAQGRADLAANAALTGLRKARDLGARLLEARGQRVLGEALAAQDRFGEAGIKIRDSVAIARRIEAAHEEALSLVSLARLDLRVGTKRARVVAYLKRAEKILGRMGARIEAAEASRLLKEAVA